MADVEPIPLMDLVFPVIVDYQSNEFPRQGSPSFRIIETPFENGVVVLSYEVEESFDRLIILDQEGNEIHVGTSDGENIAVEFPGSSFMIGMESSATVNLEYRIEEIYAQ